MKFILTHKLYECNLYQKDYPDDDGAAFISHGLVKLKNGSRSFTFRAIFIFRLKDHRFNFTYCIGSKLPKPEYRVIPTKLYTTNLLIKTKSKIQLLSILSSINELNGLEFTIE